MPVRPLMTPAFEDKFMEALRKTSEPFMQPGEHFRVLQHAIEDGAWTLSVAFENGDRTLHLPVELAIAALDNPPLTNEAARDVLIDFLGYFFESYFREARDVTLPLDWAPVRFGDFMLRARGWEKNLLLEELADRLLAGEPPEALGLPRRGGRLSPHPG